VGKVIGGFKPTINVDARQYPEFSTHFWIRGSDPAAVTAFLYADKIRFLETAKLEGILATNADNLVYFADGILLREQDFDAFIISIEKLVTNIL
jgi:hypothetical protein